MITLRPNEGVPAMLLALLACMAGVTVANLYYCQPLLNLIREDLCVSEFMVNLVPVFTQVGYALGLLFIVPLGDLYDRRRTIIFSFAVLVCSLLGIASCANIYVLLAASFVMGFSTVAPQIFIPFVSLCSRPHEKERKVGIVLTGLLVGILGSRVLSGFVGHVAGWRAMYYLAAVIILISAYAVFRWFPFVHSSYEGKFASLMTSLVRLVRGNPRAMLYSVRSGFAFGSFLGMWGCLAFRIKEAPYFAGSDVVGLLGLCGMAGALTASNVGRFIPRFGVDRINALGLLLHFVAWGCLAFCHDSYAGLIAGIILIDIGMQCIQLSNQSATMKLCPEASSRMNTIYMVTYFVGGSLGTLISGSLWSLWGWTGTVIAGLLMLCGALATMFLWRAFCSHKTY